MLEMLKKGKLISRSQVAQLLGTSEQTVTARIKELRYLGHKIQYSRSLHKYILIKKRRNYLKKGGLTWNKKE
ncbi:HTH domain-containing protein [Daejeonella sp.]|uniref:HTH domain-containing protein n=1 Tax=Daejeonella sp. TaxID=2805397 RepID=UPI00352520DC